MKIKSSIILLLGLGVSLLLSSCSTTTTEYISPEEFAQIATNFDTSIHRNNFIGAVGKRVYYEQSSPHLVLDFLGLSDGLHYTIYWTEFEEVPTELIKKLQKSKEEKQKRVEEYKNRNNLYRNNLYQLNRQQGDK